MPRRLLSIDFCARTPLTLANAVRGCRGVRCRPGDTEEGVGAASTAVLQEFLSTAGTCGEVRCRSCLSMIIFTYIRTSRGLLTRCRHTHAAQQFYKFGDASSLLPLDVVATMLRSPGVLLRDGQRDFSALHDSVHRRATAWSDGSQR